MAFFNRWHKGTDVIRVNDSTLHPEKKPTPGRHPHIKPALTSKKSLVKAAARDGQRRQLGVGIPKTTQTTTATEVATTVVESKQITAAAAKRDYFIATAERIGAAAEDTATAWVPAHRKKLMSGPCCLTDVDHTIRDGVW